MKVEFVWLNHSSNIQMLNRKWEPFNLSPIMGIRDMKHLHGKNVDNTLFREEKV